ncbi:MAG: ArnT family glycosyltransferase [Bacillota bacterium]
MKLKTSGFFKNNWHLLLISFLSFLLVYISSFVKAYGFFIDEFYYIACASRPAMGYVDHPPLAPLILTAFQSLFGNSLYAIRILPALALASSVFLTGMLTRETGGKRFSQSLASLSMASIPVAVAFAGFYSMNAFEPVIAIVLLYIFIKIIKYADAKADEIKTDEIKTDEIKTDDVKAKPAGLYNHPSLYIWAGIVMGLGVMNKHTFVLFIFALLLSLFFTGRWRLVINKWFFASSVIAFLIVLPNIIWQVVNDFPSLEFYRNISLNKNVYTPPLEFIKGQIIAMSFTVLPVWLAGVIFLLFSKRVNKYRFMSVLFILLFLFMMLSGTSRFDRLLFAYPAVLAGGAMFYEMILTKYNLKWLKGAAMIIVAAGLIIALPLILPYYSYDYVGSHVKKLGINTEIEKGKKPPLPQLLADRIAWKDKFDLVLKAWYSLPQNERSGALIAAGNYGQAGAIEYYSQNIPDFPRVVTAHNNYYLWNRGKLKGSLLLQLDGKHNFEKYRQVFDSVQIYPGEFVNSYVSPHENNLVVFICRGPKMPFNVMLDRSKFYY